MIDAIMPPPCCGAAAAGAAAAGAAAAGAAAGAACCGGGGVEAVFCCVGCCALVGGGVALLDENNGSMTDTRRTLTIAPFQTGKSMIQDNLCKNNFDALLTLCSPVATEPNAQEPIERGAILPLVVAPAFLLLLSSPCQSVTYRVQHTRTENLFLPYSTVCTLLSSSEDAAEVAKVRASRGLNICTCNSPCGRSRTVENYPPYRNQPKFRRGGAFSNKILQYLGPISIIPKSFTPHVYPLRSLPGPKIDFPVQALPRICCNFGQ